MKLVQLRRPEVRWLVLGLVLLFGLGVWASWTVWSKYRQAVDRLARLDLCGWVRMRRKIQAQHMRQSAEMWIAFSRQ